MAYTEVQKAMAIEIIARHGGQITTAALHEVRAILDTPDLPKATVWRWLRKDATDKKAVSPEARQAAEEKLDAIFETVARTYANHALKPSVVGQATASQAMTAAAIAVDKMRLLRNLPTEIVAVLPNLLDAIDRKGLKASEVFGAMLEELTRADSD